MAPVVIMLVRTFLTSAAWHDPQVLSTTRRSPGLTNWMYSCDSCSHRVYARSGFAADFHRAETRGCGCALFFASTFSFASIASPTATLTFGSPPWQVAQPSVTVPDGCIEASSVLVWQVMQPALAAFASSEVSMAAFPGVTAWGCAVMPGLKAGPTGGGPTGVLAATVHTNAIVHPIDASRIARSPSDDLCFSVFICGG